MSDEACIAFLKWCLPQLGLRWPGYRRVRRLVGKRLSRRLAELGLADLEAYRAFLSDEPGEWPRLEAMCHIPISRFYRDRSVFDAIGQSLLPEAAAMAAQGGQDRVRCWSVGCASGEEPYTLALQWRFLLAPCWPKIALAVVATDDDEPLLQRAAAACYGRSSLKELRPDWIDRAFFRSGALFCLKPEFRADVRFLRQDVRAAMPDGPFQLILCRNAVFTYFDAAAQRQTLDRMRERLAPGGFLVLGAHEALPADSSDFAPIAGGLPIYRRRSAQPPPI
jgi:chemotaxis protein methyltransferase CheR